MHVSVCRCVCMNMCVGVCACVCPCMFVCMRVSVGDERNGERLFAQVEGCIKVFWGIECEVDDKTKDCFWMKL